MVWNGIVKKKSLNNYLKSEHYLTFSFVRHPCDRLVSAYREKVERKTRGLYFKHKLIKLYHKYDFATFVEHVIKTIKEGKGIDRHVRSFYGRCAYCDMKYDVIGRAETFNQDAM